MTRSHARNKIIFKSDNVIKCYNSVLVYIILYHIICLSLYCPSPGQRPTIGPFILIPFYCTTKCLPGTCINVEHNYYASTMYILVIHTGQTFGETELRRRD